LLPGPRARSGAGPDCFPRGLLYIYFVFFFFFSVFFISS
jgi:hypothetical protein